MVIWGRSELTLGAVAGDWVEEEEGSVPFPFGYLEPCLTPRGNGVGNEVGVQIAEEVVRLRLWGWGMGVGGVFRDYGGIGGVQIPEVRELGWIHDRLVVEEDEAWSKWGINNIISWTLTGVGGGGFTGFNILDKVWRPRIEVSFQLRRSQPGAYDPQEKKEVGSQVSPHDDGFATSVRILILWRNRSVFM